MPGADLHLHTTASDGADPPAAVCRRAHAAGLRAIAITDHDSVEGLSEAFEEGAGLRLEVLAGCELTAYLDEREIHILGYGFDPADAELLEHLRTFRDARRRRTEEMVARLDQTGAPIELQRVLDLSEGGSVGRVHVARALLEAGHVSTFQEAFTRYLVPGRPAHVPKLSISPAQVIAVLHRAGGVAVLAHPAASGLEATIPALVGVGLDGIEVWHSLHRTEQENKLFAEAERLGLLKTGGSDCHGGLPGREPILGSVRIDYTHVETLRRAVERRRG